MKDVILSFKVEEEVKGILKELAQKRDMSVSAIIRAAVKKYIQEENENGTKPKTY